VLQPRQFVAGIQPGQKIFIGRSREPKNMLLILDAWIEVKDFQAVNTAVDSHSGSYSLAIGKRPEVAALLLPVGRVYQNTINIKAGATDQPTVVGTPSFEQLFKAQGTMWAAQTIAIDFVEEGNLAVCDVDVHMDWTVVPTDWWTWFTSWNGLEAAPDGSLIDGERAYP